ncbi:MAG TPA: hypothetical protein VF193_06480 [Steroidobacter sp.]
MQSNVLIQSDSDSRPIFVIDACDRVLFANDAWLEMMSLDDRAPSALTAVLGRSVWEFRPGGLVRQLWEVLYRRVRGIGGQIFVPMRADTARERRLFEIELSLLPEHAVRHVCECVWSERRPEVALLDPSRARGTRVLSRCDWCARVQVRPGFWAEVEEAQALLGIAREEPFPTLSSVACATCEQAVLQTFPLAWPSSGLQPRPR